MIKSYEQEVLNKLHKKEIEILKYFIGVCEQHNLKYFVAYGTLIGVVRHQGFIPWDDDIDVAMLREDYERFLRIVEEEKNKKFFIQSVNTEKNYHLPFAKIRMNGTKFVEHGMEETGEHLGIFIDVFPFDNIADDDKLARKQIRKAELLQRIYSASLVKCPQVGNRGGLIESISKLVWSLIYYGTKLLKIKPEILWDKYQEEVLKYRDVPTERVAFIMSDGEKEIISKKELEEMIIGSFENIEVKIPKAYDSILSRYYGDYMKLPDEDKRVNHCAQEIDFGNLS